jgi:hypothetical protein
MIRKDGLSRNVRQCKVREIEAVASTSNAQSMQGERSGDFIRQQTGTDSLRVIARDMRQLVACGVRSATAPSSERQPARERPGRSHALPFRGLLESLLWALWPET